MLSHWELVLLDKMKLSATTIKIPYNIYIMPGVASYTDFTTHEELQTENLWSYNIIIIYTTYESFPISS